MNKPTPKYLSRKPLVRAGSCPRLTARELRRLGKKKALPPISESEVAEVLADGRIVFVKTGEPFQ